MAGYAAWRQRRRALSEGALLAREARRGLKRYGHRMAEEPRAQVEAAVVGFDKAKVTGGDSLIEAVNTLDQMLDQHLAFARKSTTREYIEAIGTAVLIALFLRAFVVEAFKIPSGSMIPTLQVGDHIFVNKFIYGVRIPFTNIKLGSSVRRPRRGEVIVFIYPKDPEKDFIKRIVAVGGDTVEMRDGLLYVNNEHVENAPVDGDCVYDDYNEEINEWQQGRCEAMLERVGDKKYTTYYDRGLVTLSPTHSMRPFHVPEGEVFCMGDNRDHSSDSRIWGTVPEPLIKGKAMVIWWSLGNPNRLHGSWFDWLVSVPIANYFYGARYERMFHLVQ